jgi:hypothetical protein
MSQSRIFDIILIALAVVILIHLFYNNSLCSTPDVETGKVENMMNSLEFPTIKEVTEDLLGEAARNGGRLSNGASRPTGPGPQPVGQFDAHSVSRDNGPMQQTKKSETPYYHVTNKTVTNNSVNSDRDPSIDVVDDASVDEVPAAGGKRAVPSLNQSDLTHKDGSIYTPDELKDLKIKKCNTRECNIQSDGDNGYHMFCNNDRSKLRTLRRRRKVNRSGSYQDYVHKNKLVFADNYEGRLTSDPFDADAVQVNMSGMNMKGFLGNNPFETVKDVEGNKCNLDPEAENLKRYIREYVLDGKDQCYCATDPSKSEFTRDEIDRYREQQIEFRDKTYGTSKDFEDAVDKMNVVSMTGIKAKNQSIANFYDSIVENKFDRELKGGYKLTHRVGNLDGPGFIMGTTIPSDDCVKPPEFDLNSAVPTGSYTQSANTGGRYFLRDNFMYTNENPNNGGPDFTGVRGNDPMLDPNLIIS